LKILSMRIDFSSRFMIHSWHRGLLSNTTKVSKFQNTARGYSIDQEFHAVLKKPMDSNILRVVKYTSINQSIMDPNSEPLPFIEFNGHDPAKVQKFKYWHDGALSIRSFALNQAQLLISHTCQLTNNQKMCSLLPWYTEFPIYLNKLYYPSRPKLPS
jgi:hypothetical protein